MLALVGWAAACVVTAVIAFSVHRWLQARNGTCGYYSIVGAAIGGVLPLVTGFFGARTEVVATTLLGIVSGAATAALFWWVAVSAVNASSQSAL
jgi:VIT1/CCC1 family predicted Fe2+/Mn2+ transporter